MTSLFSLVTTFTGRPRQAPIPDGQFYSKMEANKLAPEPRKHFTTTSSQTDGGDLGGGLLDSAGHKKQCLKCSLKTIRSLPSAGEDRVCECCKLGIFVGSGQDRIFTFSLPALLTSFRVEVYGTLGTDKTACARVEMGHWPREAFDVLVRAATRASRKEAGQSVGPNDFRWQIDKATAGGTKERTSYCFPSVLAIAAVFKLESLRPDNLLTSACHMNMRGHPRGTQSFGAPPLILRYEESEKMGSKSSKFICEYGVGIVSKVANTRPTYSDPHPMFCDGEDPPVAFKILPPYVSYKPYVESCMRTIIMAAYKVYTEKAMLQIPDEIVEACKSWSQTPTLIQRATWHHPNLTKAVAGFVPDHIAVPRDKRDADRRAAQEQKKLALHDMKRASAAAREAKRLRKRAAKAAAKAAQQKRPKMCWHERKWGHMA